MGSIAVLPRALQGLSSSQAPTGNILLRLWMASSLTFSRRLIVPNAVASAAPATLEESEEAEAAAAVATAVWPPSLLLEERERLTLELVLELSEELEAAPAAPAPPAPSGDATTPASLAARLPASMRNTEWPLCLSFSEKLSPALPGAVSSTVPPPLALGGGVTAQLGACTSEMQPAAAASTMVMPYCRGEGQRAENTL